MFDAVNENLPEILNKYHQRDSRKITYDYLIDDRNLTPNTFLKIANQLSTQTWSNCGFKHTSQLKSSN